MNDLHKFVKRDVTKIVYNLIPHFINPGKSLTLLQRENQIGT